MRQLTLASFAASAALLVGCAAHKAQPEARATSLYKPTDAGPVTASALAFDPPIAAVEPSLDLSRESREPLAVLGYDEPIATFSYVRSDDRFRVTFADGDRYERRAISERVGIRSH